MIILRKTRFPESADASRLVELINRLNLPSRRIKILNLCGSHEHTVCQWGLRSLMPSNVELVPGPGCPVCVSSEEDIANAIIISQRERTILATYGDMMRVPTRMGTLKDSGGNLCMVTSPQEVVSLCKRHPQHQVVFFSVGFETTVAPVATLLEGNPPENLRMLTSHKLTPVIMEYLLRERKSSIDALVAPGHVSVITGTKVWEFLPREYRIPVVVAGFTPEDVLSAVALILKQLREGNPKVENIYRGVVKDEGNKKAQKMIDRHFFTATAKWRAIGMVPDSGLFLRERWSHIDARKVFPFQEMEERESHGCICSQVILGEAYPKECPLFKRECSPSRPVGPCMVSTEGACRIWFSHG